jgi:hypothetical protein
LTHRLLLKISCRMFAGCTAWPRKYGGKRSPDELVTEFLRHEDYNDFEWDLLIGEVDEAFVAHVKKSGLQMVRYFRDPFYGIDIKASHFGASCNGVLVKGKPSASTTNAGDVAGWGGDLITFYAEWQRDHHSYPSGYDYCRARLARVEEKSTFELDDMVEDVDAFNVAMKVRGGSTIANEVDALFNHQGYRSRMKRFENGRFGSEARTKEIARNMLLPNKDDLITLGRNALILDISGKAAKRPEDIPRRSLDGFCRGFAEVIVGLVLKESSGIPR